MSGLRYAVDDKKTDAVAHLAVARTQNTGPAFWGTTKDKGGRLGRPLFSNGAPGGARFLRVKVPNPPGSGKDIAEGKGAHREVRSEGSRMWGTY